MMLNSYLFPLAGGGGGGGATDPYFANVVLLMHYEGGTFTDSSSYARTLTAIGNAAITTAQQKYGTASGVFDGSGDAVQAPSSTDFNFGTGDFTVETYVRWNAFPAASGSIIGNYPGTWVLQYRPDAGNKIAWYNGSFVYSAAVTITTGTWYHFAVCRSGTSLRIFVDGVQSGSTITDTTNYSSANTLTIGLLNGLGQEINAWLDETRITRAARHTANFIPDAAPFPDS